MIMVEASKKTPKTFLYIIFVCYAAEGIAEQIVGSVWPVLAKDVKVDLSLIGNLTMIFYASSCITSLTTNKIRAKLGSNYTATLAISFFAIATLFFIYSQNFIMLSVGVFINGLGLGIMEVDADSYVLKAYDAKYDSILHSFWGVGAFVGPFVLSYTMKRFFSHRLGFAIILMIYFLIMTALIISKIYWKRIKSTLPESFVNLHSVSEEEKKVDTNILKIFRIKNVFAVILCFFLINGVSRALSAIMATILVTQGNVTEILAASVVGLFCVVSFIGRHFCGFLSQKIDIKTILKISLFLEAVILIILFLNILDGTGVAILIVIIGFVEAAQIPFINFYTKEAFGNTLLSTLLGYGNIAGFIGAIVTSGFCTTIIKNFSMRYVELFFAIELLLSYVIFTKISKSVDKR